MYGYATPLAPGTATLTFSGLTPDTEYDFYLYADSANWPYGTREGWVDANGSAAEIGPTDPTATTFIEGQNWIDLTPTADDTGTVVVSITPYLDNQINITGFQLASYGTPRAEILGGPAPEPGSALLWGSALLLGAGLRRKLF